MYLLLKDVIGWYSSEGCDQFLPTPEGWKKSGNRLNAGLLIDLHGFVPCLRVCPLALEAVVGLLSLGVPGSEVSSLMSSSSSGMEW